MITLLRKSRLTLILCAALIAAPAPALAQIPEEQERPTRVPRASTVTIPEGTKLTIVFDEAIDSARADTGDPVTVRLKQPLVVGNRVVLPAKTRVEGSLTDVKSAKRGFKDTGGALGVTLDEVITPDGRAADIQAGFTKLASGDARKKGAIIAGSAVAGGVAGKVTGGSGAKGAILGGVIGAAVAGRARGKEAKIDRGETIVITLEKPVVIEVA